MKLNRIHAIIGLLLVLVPFMAFSRELKTGFSMLAGAVILYFAINSIHVELRKKHRRPHRHDTFVESKPAKIEERMRSEEEQRQDVPKESMALDEVEEIEFTEAPVKPSSHVAEAKEDEPEL